MRSVGLVALLAGTVVGSSAAADVVLIAQERSIAASSTFDGSTSTLAAADFSPFVQTVSTAAEFPLAGGGTAHNTANSTINCLVDPNAISVTGSLSASGGLAIIGGAPSPVFGEASAVVVVTFQVSTPTPFNLLCLPRPSATPGDEFELEFGAVGDGPTFVRIDQNDAAQSVNLSGVLDPGQYTLQYRVELTRDEALTDVQYGMRLTLPAPSTGLAVLGLVAWPRRRR